VAGLTIQPEAPAAFASSLRLCCDSVVRKRIDHPDQFDDAAGAGLGHDVGAVGFDRALADAEVGGNDLVALAGDDGTRISCSRGVRPFASRHPLPVR
jgi:hypothetical protein